MCGATADFQAMHRKSLIVLKYASGYIGVDTWANHASNGYYLPSVVLFGSTSAHSSGYNNAINIDKAENKINIPLVLCSVLYNSFK